MHTIASGDFALNLTIGNHWCSMKRITAIFETVLLTTILQSIFAVPASAQPLTNYVVTYIELKAPSVSAGRVLLKQYGAESRRERGNLQAEVLQEIARPTRFTILEAWKDKDALTSHEATAIPHLRSDLAPIQSAPYDRRRYDGLYARLDTHPHRPNAIYAVTHIDVMPPYKDNCALLLKAMSADTPHDPGNIGYDVLRQAGEENHFTVAERWADRGAIEAHAAASHTILFRQKLLPMTGALYDERLFKDLY